MAKFFGLGSRGQKGTPVKFEFEIFIEEIRPWASAAADHEPQSATTPVLLSWRRGDNRSGSTKTVVPVVGGPDHHDGGRISFHEGFKLPATLFARKSGQFQKKCVVFSLHEESAKGMSIRSYPTPLASGELDLTEFNNLVDTASTRILLTVLAGKLGRGETPSLYLRINSIVRGGSVLSLFSSSSSRISSGSSRHELLSRSGSFSSSDSDEDSSNSDASEGSSSTDDEDTSARSSTSVVGSETKPESDRSEKLFAPTLHGNPPTLTAPKPSHGASSGSSCDEKIFDGATETKVGSVKLTEEEKRHQLLGPTFHAPPRKAFAAASAGALRAPAAKNSAKVAAAASAAKTVETPSPGNFAAAAAAISAAGESATVAYASKWVTPSMRRPSFDLSSAHMSTASAFMTPSTSSDAGRQSSPHHRTARKLDSSGSSSDPPVPLMAAMPFKTSSPPPFPSGRHKEDSHVDQRPVQLASSDPNEAGSQKNTLLKQELAAVTQLAMEELRLKAAMAEADAIAHQEKAQALKQELVDLEDELRDSAAVEVALYSVAAEHVSSAHKVHSPARRLARLYVHAYKNWSPERRATTACNSVQGLVVVVRACGNDVPRLTFWWSNMVVLREAIMQACCSINGPSSTSNCTNLGAGAATPSQKQLCRERLDSRQGLSNQRLGPVKGFQDDWRECGTFIAALLRVEAWIHGRILECVWWQAMTPPMQAGGMDPAEGTGPNIVNMAEEINSIAGKVREGLGELNKLAGDVNEYSAKEGADGNLSQLGDARRQGRNSVEIWKNAFRDAQTRLCPLQGHDLQCGCLPILSRQIIAKCVERLDVAMLNGLMRNPENDSPTDPLADPITDLSVLPIPVGPLTFGAGSQLKNVATTWSTWLSALLSVKDQASPATTGTKDGTTSHCEKAEDPGMDIHREAAKKEAQNSSPYFVLLRAAGDLLMLPKDMLMDKSVRKEVCPQLSLSMIRRIVCNFAPDEFSPDPVSPALLAAINAEVSIESRMQGEADDALEDAGVARVPPVVYTPPSSGSVRLWIGEPAGAHQWGSAPSSLLRKGHASDDELEEFHTPLAWLRNSPNTRRHTASPADDVLDRRPADPTPVYCRRYRLLKEVWGTAP